MKISSIAKIASVAVLALPASAQLTTSPLTGINHSPSIPDVGGVFIELWGTSGNVLGGYFGQSGMFSGGYYDPLVNFLFGLTPQNGGFAATDTILGFDASGDDFSALGGGLQGISIRLSQIDGETGATAPGPGNNFDFGMVELGLNGIVIDNFSNVLTYQTDSAQNIVGSSFGFESGTNSTGFFTTTDAGALAGIFAAITSGPVTLDYLDATPGDVFINFNAIPEPSALGLFGFVSVIGLAVTRRRR